MKINYDDPKTAKSVRTIQLTEMSRKRLIKHKEKLPADCVFLFPNQRGNQNGSEILCTNPIRARNFKRRVLKDLGMTNLLHFTTLDIQAYILQLSRVKVL